MTLSTISYNVYDTEQGCKDAPRTETERTGWPVGMSGPWIPGKEKDCITAEGNFQKDEYESNEILDNSYFTRKTRSMAMLEGLVPLILPVIFNRWYIFLEP